MLLNPCADRLLGEAEDAQRWIVQPGLLFAMLDGKVNFVGDFRGDAVEGAS